jgi:hypothetical protein
MRVVIPVLSWMALFGTGLPTERLTVHVVQAIPVSDAEVETIRDQLTRIWRQEGIAIDLVTSRPAPGSLRILLTEAPIRASFGVSGLCALGATSFTNGRPEPELIVSVSAVREFVRRAQPDSSSGVRSLIAARVMGRVAAHELGHYLLAETGHRPRGLMRARFDGASLLAPHLGPFLPPPRPDVEAGLVRASGVAAR